MEKFIAKSMKEDLIIEVKILNGDTVMLEPSIDYSAEGIVGLMRQWTKIEEAQTEDTQKLQIIASQLAIVYVNEPNWWLLNLDPGTLIEILNHVARTIGGLKKN